MLFFFPSQLVSFTFPFLFDFSSRSFLFIHPTFFLFLFSSFYSQLLKLPLLFQIIFLPFFSPIFICDLILFTQFNLVLIFPDFFLRSQPLLPFSSPSEAIVTTRFPGPLLFDLYISSCFLSISLIYFLSLFLYGFCVSNSLYPLSLSFSFSLSLSNVFSFILSLKRFISTLSITISPLSLTIFIHLYFFISLSLFISLSIFIISLSPFIPSLFLYPLPFYTLSLFLYPTLFFIPFSFYTLFMPFLSFYTLSFLN
ncbi:unnamed protein product [Acanthosepion pharaonis]|uniref:Uncharacterized protein n=1 Tax=Acanthosepion pharaonis TaxID=158019 RepID=A0A812E8T4_ACAPH|nr:unnamed protein product [Sepia pharaonis]